jgi:hypothetical protein
MLMSNIQLKNVPEAVHAELRRRAKLRGTTIRDYVLDLIERDQETVPYEEWIEEVRSWPPLDLPESPAEAVRAIREEREEELARKLEP